MPNVSRVCFIMILAFVSCSFAQEPEVLWERSYGAEYADGARDIQQTSDGGFILAGYSQVGNGNVDDNVYVVKTDAYGDTLWTLCNGVGWDDWATSVKEVPGDGYIITGSTDSYWQHVASIILLRLDISGDTLWTRTYGYQGSNSGSSILLADDDGFMLAAYYNIDGNYRFVLWRLNSEGDSLWLQDYDWGIKGPEGIQRTSDNGFILTGKVRPTYGVENIWIAKTDSLGNLLWTNNFGTDEWPEEGRSIKQTPDGGYVIAGQQVYNNSQCQNWYLVKTDEYGELLWERVYGGPELDFCYDVQIGPDGGYIFTGSTCNFGAQSMDVWVLKTDSEGDSLWSVICGGHGEDIGYRLEVNDDNQFIVAGTSSSYCENYQDLYLLRLGNEADTPEINGFLPGSFALRSVYPNPFNASTLISLFLPCPAELSVNVFNIQGNEVQVLADGLYGVGDHTFRFDGDQLSSGTYFVRACAPGLCSDVRRVVLVK